MGKRYVVLDRDGTIVVERHFLSDPDQVELVPRAAAALRRLAALGLGLVVLTNQSGVGRGFFDLAQLDLVHRRLRELLEAEGVRLGGIYLCPHAPDDDCPCRKPKPYLVELAGKELGFDPRTSFVIGDKVSDVELGQTVGATTFLVRTGYGQRSESAANAIADYVVEDVWEAAATIERLLVDEMGRT